MLWEKEVWDRCCSVFWVLQNRTWVFRSLSLSCWA